jgi:hypothetical protein
VICARNLGEGEVSLWDDENVLEINEVVVAKHCGVQNTTKLYTSKWLFLCYINVTSINIYIHTYIHTYIKCLLKYTDKLIRE